MVDVTRSDRRGTGQAQRRRRLPPPPAPAAEAGHERTAAVRHFSRMFVTGANLEVPIGTVALRKGNGLGA